MVVDPRAKFLYVTNYNSNTVTAYVIQAATGNPVAVSGTGYGTGTGPTCIAIEPAYGRFVYTANYLDNSVTGFKLNPSTGELVTVLNSPFPAGGLPTVLPRRPTALTRCRASLHNLCAARTISAREKKARTPRAFFLGLEQIDR